MQGSSIKTWQRVFVLVLAVAVTTGGGAQAQVCGDLNDDTYVNIVDLVYLIDCLYANPRPLPAGGVADMDRVSGVTNNDLWRLLDRIFLSFDSLECNTNLSYRRVHDTVGIFGGTFRPGHERCTVSVWMKTGYEATCIAVPFAWASSNPSVELDTIRTWFGDSSGGGATTHATAAFGVLMKYKAYGMPEVMKVAEIEFTRSASPYSSTVSIDTSGFPNTAHTIVVSGTWVQGRKPDLGVFDTTWSCQATGDVDVDGDVDFDDCTRLLDYLCFSHQPLDSPWVADVTGDCMLDSNDVATLMCYVFENCGTAPLLPRQTCCEQTTVFCDDPEPVFTIAGSYVEVDTSEGDTVYTVEVDTSGAQGIRYYPDDPLTPGIGMEYAGVDLGAAAAGLTVRLTSLVEDLTSKEVFLGEAACCELGGLPEQDSLEVRCDFSALGPSSLEVDVYLSHMPNGGASVAVDPVIGWIANAGSGLPAVRRSGLSTSGGVYMSWALDRPCLIRLASGPAYIGDEIRVGVSDGERQAGGVYSVDIVGSGLGTFTVDFTRDYCCEGMTGNVDCDAGDNVSLGDLAVLIDKLFISFAELPCEAEADMDAQQDGSISLGDLTVLIDHLFVSFADLPPCP